MTICSIDGCSKPTQGQGLCPTHYMRKRRTGTTELRNIRVDGDTEMRFHRKYEKVPDECWLMPPRGLKHGYAYLTTENGQVAAHRWAYTHYRGPIPDGKQIDHTCHNSDESCAGGPTCRHRRCVNPDHLEAVDNMTNLSRTKNHYINRSACTNGHPWDAENTVFYRGARYCRQCRIANNRRGTIRQAERRRAAGEAAARATDSSS